MLLYPSLFVCRSRDAPDGRMNSPTVPQLGKSCTSAEVLFRRAGEGEEGERSRTSCMARRHASGRCINMSLFACTKLGE
jgi:hypothetical protein